MTIQVLGSAPSARVGMVAYPLRGEPIEWVLGLDLQFMAPTRSRDFSKPRLARTVALFMAPLHGDLQESFLRSRSGGTFIRFQPKPDWLPWLRWPRIGEGVMAMEVTNDQAWEALETCLSTLKISAERSDAYSEAIAANSLERMILLLHGAQERAHEPSDKRIVRVLQLVKREIGKDITIESAAEAIGLSPSRLSHLFREQMGLSFSSYVQLERLMRARLMLTQSDNTTETIARDLGMDPSYFSSWFRRWNGLSPSSYRSSWAK